MKPLNYGTKLPRSNRLYLGSSTNPIAVVDRIIILSPMLLKRPYPKALVFALTLNAASQATFDAPSLHGLDEAALVEEIGLPQSKLSYRDTTIYNYPGQTLTLQDGFVVSSQPNELQDIEKARNKIVAQKSETSIRQFERYRDSTELSHLSPVALQEFWIRFQQRYPEVDVSMELASAQLARERQERMHLEFEIDALKETIANMHSTARPIYRRGYGYRGYHSNQGHKGFHRNEPKAAPTPIDRAALIPKTNPLPNNTHRFAIPSVRPVSPLVQ